jgi:hypothetical protein
MPISFRIVHLLVPSPAVNFERQATWDGSMPRRKQNDNWLKFKADLARGLRRLQKAQQHIQTIRANGGSDARMRKAMMVLGLAWLVPLNSYRAESLQDVLLPPGPGKTGYN